MARLFLGLLAASILLYAGLHFLGKRAHSQAERSAGQMVDAANSAPLVKGRAIVDDYKAEADNRAAIERNLKTSGEEN